MFGSLVGGPLDAVWAVLGGVFGVVRGLFGGVWTTKQDQSGTGSKTPASRHAESMVAGGCFEFELEAAPCRFS